MQLLLLLLLRWRLLRLACSDRPTIGGCGGQQGRSGGRLHELAATAAVLLHSLQHGEHILQPHVGPTVEGQTGDLKLLLGQLVGQGGARAKQEAPTRCQAGQGLRRQAR